MLDMIRDNYISKFTSNKRRSTRGSAPDASKFALVCANPFAESAIGARVPDEFSQPTVAMHSRFSATVSSSAGGTGSFIVYPSPVASFYAPAGNTVVWGGTGNFAGATRMYRGVPNGQMTANLTDFRVVGFGVRIRNLQPPGTATGMIEIAQVSCSRHMPNEGILQAYGPTDDYLVKATTGLISSSGALTSLLSLPEADEYAVQELMANDIMCIGKTTGPAWKALKVTQIDAAYNATMAAVDYGELFDTTTGALKLLTPDYADSTSVEGRTCVAIRLRGFPASTIALDMEIIYHLEGTPSTTSNQYIQSGTGALAVIHPAVVEKQVANLNSGPCSSLMPAWIAHAAGQVRQGIGNIGAGFGDAISARLGMGAASSSTSKVRRRAKLVGGVGIKALEAMLIKKLAITMGAKAGAGLALARRRRRR